MPELPFTNLDALWLYRLSQDVLVGTVVIGGDDNANAMAAKLRGIAERIQRLDEANAALSQHRSYDEGYAAALALMRSRSNILTSREVSNDDGLALMDAIAKAPVKKIPTGKRALDDVPKFNGSFQRAAKPKASKPAVDLDLSFLGDI